MKEIKFKKVNRVEVACSTCQVLKGESMAILFFLIFSQFMRNHDLKLSPLAVLGILKLMNGLDLENGTYKSLKHRSNGKISSSNF